MSLFLNPIGNPTDQQVAAQPGRRRRSVQPAPFDLKIGCRQRFELDDLGFNIRLRAVAAGCEIRTPEGPASFPASLLVSRNWRHAPASAMRYTRPRSSFAATIASPSFFFRAPEKTPRTVCGCHQHGLQDAWSNAHVRRKPFLMPPMVSAPVSASAWLARTHTIDWCHATGSAERNGIDSPV
jgi:hypothetical protein